MLSIQTVAALLALISISSAQIEPGDRTSVSDLVAVVQIHRHGQRIPVNYYPNDPWSDSSYWPAASGQLTNTGKKQHWDLGWFTRRRYNGFISSQYDPSEFYIQTTDMDRTHMSAQCNSAGIYFPRGADVWNELVRWQPIPVRVLDTNVLSSTPSCSLYQTQVSNNLVYAPEFAEINKQNQELYAYLTENSGSNVTTVSGVGSLYDTLLIESQFGFMLPEWTKSVFPEPLTSLSGQYIKAYSYTDYQKRLAAGSWLNVVLNYFSDIWEDSSSYKKYQLYSAHDYNVAAILNTLGAYDDVFPPFASTLYFELRNKSGNAVINTWYRRTGNFMPVTIKGCSSDCSLEDAQTILSPWLIDTDTYDTECSATSVEDMASLKTDPALRKAFEEVTAFDNARRK